MRRPHKHESSDASLRDGLTSSSCESSVMELEPRGQLGTAKERQHDRTNVQEQRTRVFAVSQEEVNLAWRRVRAKGGIGGVDGESIKSFEQRLDKNLYKIWNRMSSGSYHPKAVLRVEIPKGDGKKRPLGIPTILDRVAQEVVRARLEVVVEKFFHRDSYGYRPNKSAPEAVKTCRERCWRYDWVLDVDIQKFFDTIDHELMMKAVEKHCTEKWMLLYISRWLKAPVQHKDGRIEATERGTPQGGVISPLLANLYLHYSFDHWMERSFPGVKFERYADDIVIHCRNKEQSEQIEQALHVRLEECGLTLHPEKTKVVYCKDDRRKGLYPTKKFTFLGYTFQPRIAQNEKTKRTFRGFLPAVGSDANKKFRDNVKRSRIFSMKHLNLDELSKEINPKINGWFGYFSHFYKSALCSMCSWLDFKIVQWLRSKFKLRWNKAFDLMLRIARQNPEQFVHWRYRFPRKAV
jgi:RNA-directed DNA polymerase